MTKSLWKMLNIIHYSGNAKETQWDILPHLLEYLSSTWQKNNKYWLSVDKKKLLDTVSGM